MQDRFWDREQKALLGLMLLFLLGIIILGPQQTTLDAKLYYTGDEARALLQGMGDATLHRYFIGELIDLCFLSTYTAALIVALHKVLKNKAIATILGAVPGLFDLIETSTILYVLKHPEVQSVFDWLGVVTFLKWTIGMVALVILILRGVRKVSLKGGYHLLEKK